jgi:BirA family transcriptional regulator, biotin operon repressor / biotin---[acetyl-CoA-carboxylase] ligase
MALSATCKALLKLLADGQFHSGTDLAEAVGISRSAVWKHLQALEALGLALTAVSGKGYRLPQALELLDATTIRRALTPESAMLLQQLEVHDIIASTNSHLMTYARQGSPQAVACLAEYQSAGRGRRGKHWVSPYGHNIYLSLLWHYQAGPATLSGLSLAVGVGVMRVLRQYGIEDAGLKWPNDIYWRGRKLAGILIDVSGESSGPCHAVIGVGLNVHLSADQGRAIDQAWVDLQHILDTALPSRNALVASLLDALLAIVCDFDVKTATHYLQEWRRYDCMQGLPATITIGTQQIHGIVRGIDDDGLLLLEDENGELRRFASGEVSLKAA